MKKTLNIGREMEVYVMTGSKSSLVIDCPITFIKIIDCKADTT